MEVDSDAMLDGSKLAVPLKSTGGEALGLDEIILLGSALGEVLGSTLGASDGTDLCSSDGSFDGSNDGILCFVWHGRRIWAGFF